MKAIRLDSCGTHQDAEKLAELLRDYWRRKGYAIKAWTENKAAERGHPIYCLRSDLVNGLPVDADKVK